jgi:hypothetical protein
VRRSPFSFGFARYVRGFAANARVTQPRGLREVVGMVGDGADWNPLGGRRYMQNAAANRELRPLQWIVHRLTCRVQSPAVGTFFSAPIGTDSRKDQASRFRSGRAATGPPSASCLAMYSVGVAG